MEKGKNVYKDYMLQNPEWFDFSAYSEKHKIWEGLPTDIITNYIKKSKKIIGRFKDEMGDEFIRKFIGIRAKCYMIDKENNKGSKGKCKGVKSSIELKAYEAALYKNMTIVKIQINMRSQNLNMGVEKCVKQCFNGYDDKRYIFCLDRYETLPYGHWRISTA